MIDFVSMDKLKNLCVNVFIFITMLYYIFTSCLVDFIDFEDGCLYNIYYLY